MQFFDTANLLSIMLPVFFSFALPIIIFVILVNLITKFIRRKLRQKSYVKFNQRNIAVRLAQTFAEGMAYEKRVPIKEDVYCDFYIPKGKIYIEFWGYEDDEAYLKRKEQKIELYKKYGLNLIEIDNDKIGNLDDHLPKELLKFGVSLNL